MTRNQLFDQVIEQIQPDLTRKSPDLGKFTELKVINRGYPPKNPLIILVDRNGDEWVFRVRWNFEYDKIKWLNILLIELLVTEIGADLGLKILRYYPYQYDVTSPRDGSRQVRWGNIARYFPNYIPFVKTVSAVQTQSIEQYLYCIVQILVYSWWVGDTDDNGENWLRNIDSNEPLRVDFANSTCFVRSKPNAAYVQWIIAREGLCKRYFDLIKYAYECTVDSIRKISLHTYLERPEFLILSSGRIGVFDYPERLAQSCELLSSQKTFKAFISWMRKDAWPGLRSRN